MKAVFEMPKLEVFFFESGDIITESATMLSSLDDDETAISRYAADEDKVNVQSGNSM